MLFRSKEIYSFSLIKDLNEIPPDHFNTVCDSLIQEICKITAGSLDSPSVTNFRDLLYDILIFNLDGLECIWYIYRHFIKNGQIQIDSIQNRECLHKLMAIFKQYGNNYRSIFHLENAVFTIMEACIPL